jgi:hypothetical protein
MTNEALGIDWTKTVPLDELKNYYIALNQWKDPKNVERQQKIQKGHKYTDAPFLNEVESGESVLTWGVSGDSVTEIQKLLTEKQYDLNVNGLFDLKTLYAVAEFQSKNGLNENGFVDSQTLLKLKTSEKKIDCTEKINSWKSSGWVEINRMKKNALISQGKKDKIFEIMCNNDTIILYNENYSRSEGQSPVLKTIVDNPDLQEIYVQFKKLIK